MGIQGLLPLMKSIMVPIHVKDLQGRSVAVDTYSWLHKGALSCSKDLCMGLPTSRHIDYCMYRVNLLRHYGIKPILVFDGGLLPMKSDEENKRLRARKENLERAIVHESTGNSAAAYECYQKAVEISPSVAFKLIQVLKEENVDYIVAPYEADAQMAFLSLCKHVDAVITEDSDLIPFGCSRIIFKMDKFGQGVEFQYSAIQWNKDLNFTSFTKQMLLEMCILSGCDYLQSLPGMGLKRSHALLLKFKSCDKVIKHLRYNGISVPPLYEETFKKAVLTFQHQRVYDPMTEDIVHLTSIPDDLSFDLNFLGPLIPQSVVKGIAKGDLDPLTKLPFQDALSHSVCHKNYPVKEFKPEHQRKQLNSSAQNNLLTNYFCLASVEAKRKFKVPRIMSKNLKLMEEYSPCMTRGRSHGTDLSCVVEAVSCSANSSQRSVPASGNAQNHLSFKDSVDNAFTINDSQHLELTPDGKVDENINGVIGHVNCSGHDGTFQQSNHDVVEPSRPLGKSKSSYALEVIDGRTGERKVIVRSSYFKHNLLDENIHGNAGEKFIPEEENLNVVFCGQTETKSSSVVNDHVETSIVKRRSISAQAQSNESGIVEVNRAVMNAIHSTDDTKDGNFGCDVSHLNHYSDIAEKSMERFVSAISSFRHKASGSRASGLRAPLKDVQNTCAVRSATMAIDLSKFRYIPKKKKTASAS